MADTDFKGVWIPREIWDDEKLNMLEKVILSVINDLDVGEDGCWASNKYLAKYCHCSVRKVAYAIAKFKELGYIQRTAFDGRYRNLHSSSAISTSQECKKGKADVQNVHTINIKNNKKNTTPPRKRGVREMSPSFLEFWKAYPRKVAKQTAWKAWLNAGLEDKQDEANRVIADVNKRLDGEWEDKEPRYIPHPTTYLNQRRWEDEGEESPPEPSFVRWEDRPEEERRAIELKYAEELMKNGGIL